MPKFSQYEDFSTFTQTKQDPQNDGTTYMSLEQQMQVLRYGSHVVAPPEQPQLFMKHSEAFRYGIRSEHESFEDQTDAKVVEDMEPFPVLERSCINEWGTDDHQLFTRQKGRDKSPLKATTFVQPHDNVNVQGSSDECLSHHIQDNLLGQSVADRGQTDRLD